MTDEAKHFDEIAAPVAPRKTWECKDKGHEFWCRYQQETCLRQGPLTCNAIEGDHA